MKNLLIFGAGQGGKEIVKVLINGINKNKDVWNILGFIDNDKKLNGKQIYGIPVRSKYEGKEKNVYAICSLRNNTIRKKIIENEIERNNYKLVSLIHPSVDLPDDVIIEPGAVIYPDVKISYNVNIGKGVIINYNCLLGHDLTLGSFTFIGPSVTFPGRCKVGNGCLVGPGVTFMEGIEIGSESVIGVGTTVLSKVKGSTSVIDLPRKIVRDIN